MEKRESVIKIKEFLWFKNTIVGNRFVITYKHANFPYGRISVFFSYPAFFQHGIDDETIFPIHLSVITKR